MLVFKSKLSAEELKDKWDEFTSPARFAGSDDNLDLIFISKRKDSKVKLVRRAKSSHEPFSCVFRGTICASEGGSEIKGVFTKSWVDYFFTFAVIGLLFYIRNGIIERGEPVNTINVALAFSLVAAALLLMNTRKAKRKYCDFISRITGIDNEYFLTKSEEKDKEGRG